MPMWLFICHLCPFLNYKSCENRDSLGPYLLHFQFSHNDSCMVYSREILDKRTLNDQGQILLTSLKEGNSVCVPSIEGKHNL